MCSGDRARRRPAAWRAAPPLGAGFVWAFEGALALAFSLGAGFALEAAFAFAVSAATGLAEFLGLDLETGFFVGIEAL